MACFRIGFCLFAVATLMLAVCKTTPVSADDVVFKVVMVEDEDEDPSSQQ